MKTLNQVGVFILAITVFFVNYSIGTDRIHGIHTVWLRIDILKLVCVALMGISVFMLSRRWSWSVVTSVPCSIFLGGLISFVYVMVAKHYFGDIRFISSGMQLRSEALAGLGFVFVIGTYSLQRYLQHRRIKPTSGKKHGHARH